MSKIKHIFLTIMLALLSATSVLAVDTIDKIGFSSATLTPGETGTQYMTVVLLGSRIYCALNFDVKLPEGVEPVFNSKGKIVARLLEDGILPNDDGQFYHTVSCTYTEEDRNLRISCVSTDLDEFNSEAGTLFKLPFKVSTYVKPGTLDMNLSGQALTTADATEYDPADATDTNIAIGTTAKASLSVSSTNKWSTCILPFATALPDGLKAYTISSKDDDKQVFYLSDASSIEAYTPYILYSESGYTGTLTGEVDASQYPESGKVAQGYLTGAVEAQTTNEGYILQKQSGVVKFYLADPSKTYNIPAGKCWATPPAGTTQSYSFDFPTAVKGIAEVAESKNESKYNLSGIMIDAPRKGQLYIQNGRKYVK